MSTIRINTITLEELLQKTELDIPVYQRPYSWTEKQLEPLLIDLYQRKSEELLIMGGIILHEWKKKKEDDTYETILDIVDGQQRLITFSILKSINDKNSTSALLNKSFTNADSVNNIQQNARFINHFINKKKASISLSNIHFIVVTTTELDEAFAFFDSQNTRGKKLEDYDILKAHHLRYIKSDLLATQCAIDWEFIEKQREKTNIGLGLLLDTYLGRGRGWSNKIYFPTDIKEEFKSQRKTKKEAKIYSLNRYQQGALFSSWSYDPTVKRSLEFQFEEIDASFKVGGIEILENQNQYYPFQITQTIEGGELFFWYTQKYYSLYKTLFDVENINTSIGFKQLIQGVEVFNYNTGCVYVKEVFKAALLFYVDKFGYHQLEDITANLFFVIYWLRFKQSRVSYNSIYKYLREEFNPFSLIKEASFSDYIIKECEEFLEDKYLQIQESVSGIRSNLLEEVKHSEKYRLLNSHIVFKNFLTLVNHD